MNLGFSLDGWGSFLGGLAAMLGAVWAIIGTFFVRAAKKHVEATTEYIQSIIKTGILAEINGRKPESYYTLDFHDPSGLLIALPMIPWVPVRISENVRMGVIDHSEHSTTILLTCDGFGSHGPHFHAETIETIEVRRGTVTDVVNNRTFREGEVWTIPAKKVHTAVFRDCICLVTHQPCLPTASQRPVNVDDMERIVKRSLVT